MNHDTFQDLLKRVKTDDQIIGFFLVGSRGKGFEDERSDYDAFMIVTDRATKKYKKEFQGNAFPQFDICVMSFSEFSKYAVWEGHAHWDRYNFAHVRALVDKTGRVQPLINEKGSIPKTKRTSLIRGSLDAYLNAFFRSVKSSQRKDTVGMRLEAAASVPYLLDALFALHDRIAPFPDYLARELKQRPLKQFPWGTKKLIRAILVILENGDLETQQELAKATERTFRKKGHGGVFDAWKGKDQWAMSF